MSVFTPRTASHLAQPMFLGECVDVARYEQVKYPWIDKMTDTQLSFFWRPEEIDLSKDRIDFNQRLTPNEQHIFTSNLKYQTLLDSVQGRGPNLAFLPIVSIPELETWIETWAFSETIHSRSYTHILRNIYNNPTEVLDSIVMTPEILTRAAAVTEEYDKLIAINARYQLAVNTSPAPVQHMEAIYRTLASVNILEGVRFYVSFACSFAFNERALMEGNSKTITLIARDESLHLAATQRMLQAILDGSEGSEWQRVAVSQQYYLDKLFDEAVEQEKIWATYLFKDGSMLGLNTSILHQYIEYIANVRYKALGFSVRYATTKNPLPWTNSYFNRSNVQVAPQETEISSYLTGAINTDTTKLNLSTFSL
jgi:ribonucleoside-diphosphate reductase beta chain